MYPSELTDTLGRQYRLIAHRQLRSIVPDPLERRELQRRLDLRPITGRVLGQVIHEPGPGRRLMTEVLDAGAHAALWGKTATTWWGMTRFRLTPIHVGRLRGSSRPPAGAQLHNLRALACRDITEHRGIPIARPELAIRWLAGAWTHRWPDHPEIVDDKLGRTLDHAWRENLIDGRYLHELAERTGGRGRSGIVALRRALETRPADYLPTGSGAESRFEEIIRPQDLVRLRRQVAVSDDAPIGVTDYEARCRPLVIEINGEQWHTTEVDRRADDRRYDRLLAMGYSVLVLWQYDVWHEPGLVRAVTAQLLDQCDAVPRLHRPTPAPWQL